MLKTLLSKLNESVLRRRQVNPGPREADRNLVIHSPAPAPESPLLFSLERIWRLPRFDPDANPSAGQQPANQILHTLEWIWDGLASGQPSDGAPGQPIDPDSCTAPYVDPPAPKEIHWEMRPHLLALRRLKKFGYLPDFVIDVGASTGYWSHLCQQVFPNSRFYLFEPLLSEYRQTQVQSTVFIQSSRQLKSQLATGLRPLRLTWRRTSMAAVFWRIPDL